MTTTTINSSHENSGRPRTGLRGIYNDVSYDAKAGWRWMQDTLDEMPVVKPYVALGIGLIGGVITGKLSSSVFSTLFGDGFGKIVGFGIGFAAVLGIAHAMNGGDVRNDVQNYAGRTWDSLKNRASETLSVESIKTNLNDLSKEMGLSKIFESGDEQVTDPSASPLGAHFKTAVEGVQWAKDQLVEMKDKYLSNIYKDLSLEEQDIGFDNFREYIFARTDEFGDKILAAFDASSNCDLVAVRETMVKADKLLANIEEYQSQLDERAQDGNLKTPSSTEPEESSEVPTQKQEELSADPAPSMPAQSAPTLKV